MARRGLDGQQGTGVFFPPSTISDLSPADSSSSAASTPCCWLLFSSQQHADSAQWPEAMRGPAVSVRPGATAPKRQQLQLQQRNMTPGPTEARPAISSSLGLPAAHILSSSSSSSSSTAFAATHAADVGLWGGAASITAQRRQPAGSQSSQPRVIVPLAPAMSDRLSAPPAVLCPYKRGGLPATMWFDVVQHDSMQPQAESPDHSLSWASNDNLMLPAPPLDASGLSPTGGTCSSTATTHGAQAARPRRSSLLGQPSHSPPAGAPAFSEPIAVPCLASGSGSLLQDQGGSWGSLFAGCSAPSLPLACPAATAGPPLSLLKQHLLLTQGASTSGMESGTSGLEFVAGDLLAASSAGLVLPLGQQPMPPLAVPAEAAVMLAGGPAAAAAAAQSKLRQLAMIGEMMRTLEQELLEILRV